MQIELKRKEEARNFRHRTKKFTWASLSILYIHAQYDTVTEGWLLLIQGSMEAHILECWSSCLTTRLVSISFRLTPSPDTEPLTRIDCPQGHIAMVLR
jgi:hypothetical protein